MKWAEIRQNYPNQWLLVEVITAHSEDDRRVLEDLAVLYSFDDSAAAWRRYTQLHHDEADREFYILHTDREELHINERVWFGIRIADSPAAV